MLARIRKSNQSIFAKMLMGVLVLSFVGWGAAGWIFGETRVDDSLVRVGNSAVSMAMFENERNRQIQHMSREQQREVWTNPDANSALSQQILSSLIAQTLLDLRAEYMGFAVSRATIASIIRNDPTFQIDGRFSGEMFDRALANNNMRESEFIRTISTQIKRDMVQSGIAFGIHTPDFITTARLAARSATRQIEFARVPFADHSVTGAPTDDDLRIIHSRNPVIIPEQRTISYIKVTADMSRPDLVDSAYIQMQRIEDMLIGGSTMASAARTHNAVTRTFTNVPVDFAGVNNARNLNDMARRIAFTIDQGTESEIIEVATGFIIVRVDEIAHAHNAPLESVRADIVRIWRTEQQRVGAYKRANDILRGVNMDGESLGRTISVTRMAGAPLEVLNAAFSARVGTNFIVPGANDFFVVRVIDQTTPTMTAEQLDAARADAARFMSRSLQEDYTAFLSRTYQLRPNDRLMRRVFSE